MHMLIYLSEVQLESLNLTMESDSRTKKQSVKVFTLFYLMNHEDLYNEAISC